MTSPRKKSTSATLSFRVRASREEKGWSRAALAAAAHTTESLIGDIEDGRLDSPENIEDIAKALEVSPWWLVYGIH